MGNLRREELLARADQRVSTVGVLHAHVNQPIQIPRMAPVLIKKLEEDDLRDTAGVLRRHLAVPDEPFDELLAAYDPAHTRPGRNDLGKGLEAEHASVHVHAQVRRDERLDEFVVRGGRGRERAVCVGVGLHLQEIVGFVFDDDDVVFLRDLVDGLAAFAGLRGARGVLACRDGVQHKRLAGSSSGFVPVAEDLVHGLGLETLLVHLDRRPFQAKRESRFRGTGESVLLQQDIITSLGKHAKHRIPAVRATSVEAALPVRVGRVVNNLNLSTRQRPSE